MSHFYAEATAPYRGLSLLDEMLLRAWEASARWQQQVEQVGHQVQNWVNAPRDTNCMQKAAVLGAGTGAAIGGVAGGLGGGAVGAAAGSIVPVAGNAAGLAGRASLGAGGGAALGGAIGYAGGLAIGFTACMSSSGGTGSSSGTGGTQVTSKTLWKDGEGGRIDVENPNPGQRPGQIHYQDQTGKYLYDPKTGQFDGAPNRVNQLLNDARAQAAIQKGLRYLGQ